VHILAGNPRAEGGRRVLFYSGHDPMLLAISILAALYRRRDTGQGASASDRHAGRLMIGPIPARSSSAHSRHPGAQEPSNTSTFIPVGRRSSAMSPIPGGGTG